MSHMLINFIDLTLSSVSISVRGEGVGERGVFLLALRPLCWIVMNNISSVVVECWPVSLCPVYFAGRFVGFPAMCSHCQIVSS